VAASAGACAAGLFVEKFLAQHAFETLPHRPILQLVFACQAIFLLLFAPTAWGVPVVGRAGLPAPTDATSAGRLAEKKADYPNTRAGLPALRGQIPARPTLPALQRQQRTLLQRLGVFLLRSLLSLAVCSPIYLIAAWLSDATAVDVFRGLLFMLCLVLAASGLSLWVDRRGAYAILQLILALAVLGLPCVWYILAESGLGDWSKVNSFSPLVQAWRVGASRLPLLTVGWLMPGVISAGLGLFLACVAWSSDRDSDDEHVSA
jgi:hypothetical protein